MTRSTSRYLFGLLLATVPAAASAQDALKPALRPGQMVVARQDTVVNVKRDTVITVKKDTAYVVKYDTMPVPKVLPATSNVAYATYAVGASYNVPDSVITRAVRLGVMQALKEQQQGKQEIEPRPDYLKTWDRMQERRKIHRVDREMMRAVFVPKGQWMMGTTFNYQEWDTENINLLVLKNMDIEGHTFSVSPYFGYFVANNIAVGARYNYNRNYFFLGKFDLNLGEDFNISLEDLYYLEHTHEATAFMRTYMGLGRSNVFGFFSEIRGTYAHTVGKNTTGSGADFDGSFERINSIQLTFCPGMAAFVTDFMAAEASIGVMGLKYRWKNQTTNRVEEGKSRSGGANFKFNLLSINLGVTFYL